VHRIRHIVGPIHHLGLEAGAELRRSVPHPVGRRHVVAVETELVALWTPLPRVLGDSVQACTGQIQTSGKTLRIKDFGLKPGQDTEVLGIALESAVRLGDLIQRALAVVSVGRMADVVGQPGHVDEVGVAAETDRHAATDLRDLQ
jgi:hypothetical protein